MSSANPDQAPNSRAGVAIHVPYWLGGDPKHGGSARDMLLRVNFNKDGTVREVFARPFKTGADLEGLLDKFCIAVSRALKFGDTIENFWACIDGTGTTAVEGQDIFTAVVRGALMLERESLAIVAALVPPAPISAQTADALLEADMQGMRDHMTGIDEPPPGIA